MTLTAEGSLLLDCARSQFDDNARERIGIAVRQKPDWAYLKRAAVKNKVLPLVYNGLMQNCADSVPVEVVQDWRRAMDENAARVTANQGILLDAVARLENDEIPCVPFKGITFAQFAYGDIALRMAGDVDLLVRPAHFIKARDILIQSGFSQYYFGHAEVSTVQGTLVDSAKRLSIDLHYALTPYYQHTSMEQAQHGSRLAPGKANRLDTDSTHWFFWLDCDPLWERLSSVTIADRKLPIFSLEDLLLVAAINGIKENWRMLSRVTDLADLVRAHPGIDWDAILRQARAQHFERKLQLGLLLARDLSGAPLPPEISRYATSSASVRSLLPEIRERFCQDTFKSDIDVFRLIAALYSMDSFSDRWWYLVYIARRLLRWAIPTRVRLSIVGKLLRQLGLAMAEITRQRI